MKDKFKEWHNMKRPGYYPGGPLWPVAEEAFDAGYKACVSDLQAWEPIETAPMDGTVFLGFSKIHKIPIAILFLAEGQEYAEYFIEKTLTTRWPLNAFTFWKPMINGPEV